MRGRLGSVQAGCCERGQDAAQARQPTRARVSSRAINAQWAVSGVRRAALMAFDDSNSLAFGRREEMLGSDK